MPGDLRPSLRDLLPASELPESRCSFDRIISFGGNWSSGSSIVGNFLKEFPDIDVIGQIYSGSGVDKKQGGELHFFVMTWFCRFSRLMGFGTDAERDFTIKMLIHDLNTCYRNKKVLGEKYSPEIYNEKFLQIAKDLLFSILDLNEYDIEILKNNNFPIRIGRFESKFDGCSFIKGAGKFKHVFYRVRNISPDKFGLAIRTFVEEFLNLYYKDKKILAGDQLCYNQTNLETINYYLFDKPIKQISVYRDPRDQFFSILRGDLNLAKNYMVNSASFINFYKNSRQYDYVSQNPYDKHLVLRFEDMVLNYDKVTAQITDFLGLNPAMHKDRKKFFDPAISVNNIGCYQLFSDQRFMREIETGLGEFCYHPEKENLSEDSWKLLNSRTFFKN